MILSGKQIEKLCVEDNLIAPFNVKNLRNSSYDLTLGNEIYCGSQAEKLRIRTTYLAEHDGLNIPAYGFAYILCNEHLKLNKNISARVSLRMPLIYKGLVLTVQPPFDPQYNGKVIVLLHNMTSQPVYLKRGERIVTIEFTYVWGELINSKQSAVSSLQEKLSHEMKSGLTELFSHHQKIDKKYSFLLTVVLGAIPALAAIAFAASPVISSHYEKKLDYKYSMEIEALKNDINKLNRKLEEQQALIKEYNQNSR